MSPLPLPPARPTRPRWFWGLVASLGACGAAASLWFQELIAHGEEVLGLVLLPVMAAAIYGLDILMFRSRMPGRGRPPTASGQEEQTDGTARMAHIVRRGGAGLPNKPG